MFEIYQSEKTQKFHFRLKAGNGEIIFTGQAYKDKSGCENGVASVKKNGTDASNFEIKESTNGKQYFVLKAGNGQIIGQSQMYKSASGLKNGIASIGKNCDADCKDLTA
ncbi:MAG: YegP family protein [Verrucomicrobiae bacterium]|nr:YegP family protein [Verrucomicrobiae bacterium]NNJ42832.1 YegP family protein [Akkermansiaceae bacterium]